MPGPLSGVPWLLKDLAAERAGEPFHEGLVEARDAGYVSTVTSDTVQSWLDAGAIQIAKSNTEELGMAPTCEPSAYPPTRNPWNLERTPAGSSGGSAAAVAAGLVPIAYANDAGGSIRMPASACGLVGLKPSRGRVASTPVYGDVGAGMTTELAVTRTVRDTATILDAVQGWRPGSPYVAPPPARPYVAEATVAAADEAGPLRIAVSKHYAGGGLHAECTAAVDSVAALLSDLGHRVTEDRPAALDRLTFDAMIPQYLGLAAWAAADWEERLGRPLDIDKTSPVVRPQVEGGRTLTVDRYLVLRQHLQQAARDIEIWHLDVDVLVTATMADPPAPIGQCDLQRMLGNTMPANITGQPAISLPLHWTTDGLPVGVQFTAAYGREDVLLRLAAQLEQARPWADRRPPVNAG